MSERETEYDQGLLEYLGQFITEHKKSVMERVLAERTRFITVVLEDIFLSRMMPAQFCELAIVLEFRTFM